MRTTTLHLLISGRVQGVWYRESMRLEAERLAACRTLGSDSENWPRRGQFSTISPGNSGTIAQEMGEKWAGAVGLQPEIPKPDRLLSITGWVRNRSEGMVEAVVQGSDEAVAALLTWARRGPPAARVDDIVSTPVTGEFSHFERRPTA